MEQIPIVLFAYNRPQYLSKTLEALKNNEGADEHPLYVYCDGASENLSLKQHANINEVRRIARNVTGFKSLTVKINSTNKGLVKSITSGVTEILSKYTAIIVIEDDLVTGKYFLKYMRDALKKYQHSHKVISIHGFNHHIPVRADTPSTFFLRGADCWGWATWRRGWALYNDDSRYLHDAIKNQGLANDFDFDKTYPYSKMLRNNIEYNNSWAIKWYASAYLNNKLTLYPAKTLVRNIGEKGSNFRMEFDGLMGSEVSNDPVISFPEKEVENVEIRHMLSAYFRENYSYKSQVLRILKYLLKIFKGK